MKEDQDKADQDEAGEPNESGTSKSTDLAETGDTDDAGKDEKSLATNGVFAIVSAGLLVALLSSDTRLSIALEYELMDACVDRSHYNLDECACALELTIEDGWAPDYDDGDLDSKSSKDRFKAKHRRELRHLEKNDFLKNFGNFYADCSY